MCVPEYMRAICRIGIQPLHGSLLHGYHDRQSLPVSDQHPTLEHPRPDSHLRLDHNCSAVRDRPVGRDSGYNVPDL